MCANTHTRTQTGLLDPWSFTDNDVLHSYHTHPVIDWQARLPLHHSTPPRQHPSLRVSLRGKVMEEGVAVGWEGCEPMGQNKSTTICHHRHCARLSMARGTKGLWELRFSPCISATQEPECLLLTKPGRVRGAGVGDAIYLP